MRFTGPAGRAFLAALLPAVALADPPLPVLREVGQLGRWATVSCEAPAGPQNLHMIFYEAGKGLVRRRLERGDAPALDGAVDSARQLAPGRLALTLRNDDPNWGPRNGMVFETEVEIAGDRARTLSSVGSDGTVFISDGTFQNGSPVPTMIRCPERPRS
jgi:hypothetical protein